jgi:hypothetical protein
VNDLPTASRTAYQSSLICSNNTINPCGYAWMTTHQHHSASRRSQWSQSCRLGTDGGDNHSRHTSRRDSDVWPGLQVTTTSTIDNWCQCFAGRRWTQLSRLYATMRTKCANTLWNLILFPVEMVDHFLADGKESVHKSHATVHVQCTLYTSPTPLYVHCAQCHMYTVHNSHSLIHHMATV